MGSPGVQHLGWAEGCLAASRRERCQLEGKVPAACQGTCPDLEDAGGGSLPPGGGSHPSSPRA